MAIPTGDFAPAAQSIAKYSFKSAGKLTCGRSGIASQAIAFAGISADGIDRTRFRWPCGRRYQTISNSLFLIARQSWRANSGEIYAKTN
ncbi:MAG: hypothetical protein C4325_14420 [Blastocatellia bacterium]